MKKLLLALLLSISLSANAGTPIRYKTKCIAGYMFAVVYVIGGNGRQGVSMVQIFKEGDINDRFPPQPMRCK